MALERVERTRRSRSFRAGERIVLGWMRVYTRTVDPRIAADREVEVGFELWEFGIAAERYRWSGPRAGGALALRTVRGMPRDWMWRHDALRTGAPPSSAPVSLLSRRRRPRTWVPLQFGHTFDQTNGVIEPERALPHEGSRPSLGAAGNAFGMQGGF